MAGLVGPRVLTRVSLLLQRSGCSLQSGSHATETCLKALKAQIREQCLFHQLIHLPGSLAAGSFW